MVKKDSGIASTRERRVARAIHYTLSYIVQGEEYGTDGAIVLLHDIPAGAFAWEETLDQLRGLKRAVYAIDLLGYGESEHPWPSDTSVWGHADALAFLFKELNLTNIVLVGHGLGGGVAQILSARLYRNQVHGLILIDSICYLHTFAENWPLTQMEQRRDFDAPQHTELADLIKDLRQTLPAATTNKQKFAGVAEKYVSPWNNEQGKEMLFQHIRNLIPYYLNSVSTDIQKTGISTLIIWGEKDEQIPLSYAERLHRDIPNSQLITVPNAGHFILLDAPATIAKSITDFANAL